MRTQILNTPWAQIFLTKAGYQLLIKMSEGGWVEHNPFPPKPEGLVAAMQVATEVCAGKFFLKQVASPKLGLTNASSLLEFQEGEEHA